jgi:hypothetical protein
MGKKEESTINEVADPSSTLKKQASSPDEIIVLNDTQFLNQNCQISPVVYFVQLLSGGGEVTVPLRQRRAGYSKSVSLETNKLSCFPALESVVSLRCLRFRTVCSIP